MIMQPLKKPLKEAPPRSGFSSTLKTLQPSSPEGQKMVGMTGFEPATPTTPSMGPETSEMVAKSGSKKRFNHPESTSNDSDACTLETSKNLGFLMQILDRERGLADG